MVSQSNTWCSGVTIDRVWWKLRFVLSGWPDIVTIVKYLSLILDNLFTVLIVHSKLCRILILYHGGVTVRLDHTIHSIYCSILFILTLMSFQI